MNKKIWIISASYVFLLLVVVVVLYLIRPQVISPPDLLTLQELSPTPTPYVFTTYTPPTISKKNVYKIAMVGDSMTAALGPHGGEMSEYINSLYEREDKTQPIIIDNYSISSSILALNNQLTQEANISEYSFGPLLSVDYDIILIESFGYNPLSDFGIEAGIMRQTEELDKLMTKLITKKPETLIIFVATIAPNILTYGQSTQPDSTAEDRRKLAEERMAYIKNHIEYANSHNIPLINIYEKSLNANGDGNTRYINANDDIHPSFVGITFIGEEIGNYIFDNNLLPIE